VPHLIVEYSDNLDSVVDIDKLLRALHNAALATGTAPADALRTRAEPRSRYLIADQHPDNGFVAIVARLGPGRSSEEKHAFLNALLASVEQSLGVAIDNVMISVEYQEIDAEFRINQNHLRETIKKRSAS
jgi:5-carboxymethyl-2-hydroxymuconate isomerase